MKALSILLILSIIGCTQAPEAPTEPKQEAPKTRPNIRQKPKRMICNEKIATVAVIDTGMNDVPEANLCRFGHKDFTNSRSFASAARLVDPVPRDNHGHGTNIAGVIQAYAGDAKYCMVILKYYDPKDIHSNNLANTIKAINYATSIGIKYINYSGGGLETSAEEIRAVKNFIDKGGKFIAAAGNERSDLGKFPYYPAMDDDRVIVVGSIERNGQVSRYSNFGTRVNRWEYGTDQVGYGVSMSGTSQATAVATGKIINESECDK